MMSHTPQQAKASTPLQQSKGLEAGTDLYGLLGFPLGHSFSRAFHNKRFADEGINAEYVNFELPDIEELPALIESHPNLRGLNVTIPYKQAVIPFLDEMSDEAQAIGAVNVIRITRPDGTGRSQRLQFRRHRLRQQYTFPPSASPQARSCPWHRRCFQSRLLRSGTTWNRMALRKPDATSRHTYLLCTHAFSDRRLHSNSQLHPIRHVSAC